MVDPISPDVLDHRGQLAFRETSRPEIRPGELKLPNLVDRRLSRANKVVRRLGELRSNFIFLSKRT